MDFTPDFSWIDVADPENPPAGAKKILAADLLRYEHGLEDADARFDQLQAAVAVPQIAVILPIDYGAVGDGVTDDTFALQAAVDAAIAGGLALHLTDTYLTSEQITINGLIRIDGKGTIHASNNNVPVLELNAAHGSRISNITLAGTATVRNATGYGIRANDCEDINLSGIRIHDTAAAGLFAHGIHKSTIDGCHVWDTLADGIHITNASSSVAVTGNKVTNTGDDGIACVSYLDNGAPVQDVSITGNIVRDGLARGIAVVGGTHITISGNTVNGTASSGILTNADSEVWFTYTADFITINGNTVTRAGQVTPRAGNTFGIEAGGGCSNINITGNTISASFGHGISTVIFGTVIAGNTVDQAGNTGIDIGADMVVCSGNFVRYSQRYGIATTNATPPTGVAIVGNNVADSNMSGSGGVDGIIVGSTGANTNVVCVGNIVTETTARQERAIQYLSNGGSFYGNVASGPGGNYVEIIPGSTNIFTAGQTGTDVPPGNRFAAGTTYLRRSTGDFSVYDGTNWRTIPLN